jgi:hypothetical protein
MLNPMMPAGSNTMFNNMDANGNPTTAITNQLVNFGWEYVYHCHILSHEEMDMMRPVSVAIPPIAPDGLTWTASGNGNKASLTLTWNDNSINETSFVVQKAAGTGAWVDLVTIDSPLDQPNTHGPRSYTDTSFKMDKNIYSYRVVAKNTIGYGGQFMSLTAQSVSTPVSVIPAPTNLTATLQAGPQIRLAWTDNTSNETGYVVERSVNGGAFATLTTLAANATSYVNTGSQAGATYAYRVAATSAAGPSAYSNTAQVVVPVAPAAPTSLSAANGANSGNNRSVILNWTANLTNVTGFTIQRATNAAFTSGLASVPAAATATTYTWTGLSRNTSYYFRIVANNGFVPSAPTNATPFPILTNP